MTWQDTTLLELTPDFTALGSDTYRRRIFENGNLISDVDGLTESTLALFPTKVGGKIYTETTKIKTRRDGSIRKIKHVRICISGEVTVAGVAMMSAYIEFSPSDETGALTIESVDQVELSGAGFAELYLADAYLHAQDRSFRAINDAVITGPLPGSYDVLTQNLGSGSGNGLYVDLTAGPDPTCPDCPTSVAGPWDRLGGGIAPVGTSIDFRANGMFSDASVSSLGGLTASVVPGNILLSSTPWIPGDFVEIELFLDGQSVAFKPFKPSGELGLTDALPDNMATSLTLLGGSAELSFSMDWVSGRIVTLLGEPPILADRIRVTSLSPVPSLQAIAGFQIATSTMDELLFLNPIANSPTATLPSSGRAGISGVEVRPNPFNPRTVISFTLEQAGDVTVDVFDPRGRLVATLLHQSSRSAGPHRVSWSGTDGAGRNVASGVYIAQVRSGGHTAVQRMTLVK
ncbi:hypothetical protein DRQ53_10560 [bacterium]|nr:MAG: hypothetical protein DRQ53_10560 [bacterium]